MYLTKYHSYRCLRKHVDLKDSFHERQIHTFSFFLMITRQRLQDGVEYKALLELAIHTFELNENGVEVSINESSEIQKNKETAMQL